MRQGETRKKLFKPFLVLLFCDATVSLQKVRRAIPLWCVPACVSASCGASSAQIVLTLLNFSLPLNAFDLSRYITTSLLIFWKGLKITFGC